MRCVCSLCISDHMGSGPHRSTKNVLIKVIGDLLVAKSSGQLSPSSSLLACLQCLDQLLTRSSSTSFILTWLPGPLALLATFSHHWLLCLSALWILAHFLDLPPSKGPRAQALLSPPFLLACAASLTCPIPWLSNTIPFSGAILGLPTHLSAVRPLALPYLFLDIQSASPVMCPQHTLSFPSMSSFSAEGNPIHSCIAKPETTGSSWTPFFLSYPTFRNS